MTASLESVPLDKLLELCVGRLDPEGWVEFVRRFQPLIARVVCRMVDSWEHPRRQLVDDLIQETYLKLCQNDYRVLRDFRAESPDAIYGLLKVVAANVVRDHFKSKMATKRGEQHGLDSLEQTDPADAGERQRQVEHDVLLREIQDCLEQSLPGREHERDRLIFLFYFRLGLTAAAIAKLPWVGLTIKGVESSILRSTRVLRKRILHEQSASSPHEGIQAAESL